MPTLVTGLATNRESRPGFLLFRLLILLGIAMASSLRAQVIANGPRDPTEFRSPMILETVFLPADRTLWKTQWVSGKEYLDVRQFHGDNVSISALSMRPRLIEGGKGVVVEIKTSLSNRCGHDKQVTVRFDILNGDEEVAHVTLGPLKVEETDTKTRSVIVTVPETALKMDPMTVLRITLTAKDI